MTDGESVLAEYTGTFWIHPSGNFTDIEVQGADSISMEPQFGPAHFVRPHFNLHVAGNLFWNGRHCAATLTDSQWRDRSTGEPVAIVLKNDARIELQSSPR
jgi:hypothetical protein